jgi:hypothetical protein
MSPRKLSRDTTSQSQTYSLRTQISAVGIIIILTRRIGDGSADGDGEKERERERERERFLSIRKKSNKNIKK